MHVESEDYLNKPAAKIYPLVRDELPKLLPYLPDVERIVQVSREQVAENRTHIVNRWTARANIPRVAAKFIPPDVFTWTDDAMWFDDEFRVEFRLESFGYEVTGVNYFVPEGEGTRIRVTADVVIHPEQFKVPRMLFNRVFPALEGAIKKAVQPNLTALARGLRDYYAALEG